MRTIFALAIVGLALAGPANAHDPLTGDLTEAQINAIKMSAVATYAGSHDRCPRFHVIERATFEELADGGITSAVLDTTEYQNAYMIAALGAIERELANPSKFCKAAWKLFGSGGLSRRQMLEAN